MGNTYVDYVNKTGNLPLINRAHACKYWFKFTNEEGIPCDVNVYGRYFNKEEVIKFMVRPNRSMAYDRLIKLNFSPKNLGIIARDEATLEEEVWVTGGGATVYEIGGKPVESLESGRELTHEEQKRLVATGTHQGQIKSTKETPLKSGSSDPTKGELLVWGGEYIAKMKSGGEIDMPDDIGVSGADKVFKKFGTMGLIALAVVVAFGVIIVGRAKK